MHYPAAHVELKGFCSHGGGVLLPEPGILRVQGCQPAASRNPSNAQPRNIMMHQNTEKLGMRCIVGAACGGAGLWLQMYVLISKDSSASSALERK